MDEPTKKASLEKLTYIRSKFVTPDIVNNDEAIDRYYQDVGHFLD